MNGDTNSYYYYNRNPDGAEIEDCVCRAISTATGIDYDITDRLLTYSAAVNKCDKLCVCCYHYLLEDVFGYSPRFCYRGETVHDISRMWKNKKVIIRIDRHLTCSMYGVVSDIWDCTNEKVDCFWVVD